MGLSNAEILERYWYYTMEYEKNKFTPGKQNTNCMLTREAFRRIDFKDKTVLDIGCMEGFFSVLAARAGAKQVVATDRYSFDEKIDFVKSAFDVSFDYHGGLEFPQLMDLCNQTTDPTVPASFDVVNFSGILYHMYDFMNGFAMVRSLAKKGGIAIIESLGYVGDKYDAHFNAHGHTAMTDPHSYFSLSVTLIDYLCRYFAMRPIDFFWLPRSAKEDSNLNGEKFGRFCFVCRIESDPIEIGNDPFLDRRIMRKDEKTGLIVDSGERRWKQDDRLIFKKNEEAELETFVTYDSSLSNEDPLIFPNIVTNQTLLTVNKEGPNKKILRLDDWE